MFSIGLIAALVIAVIYYFDLVTTESDVVGQSDVVEVDVVNVETGEVEQAAAKVDPNVVVTDIKINSKSYMTLAEVQLIDMSDKPINIKDASVTSSAINKKFPRPASRLVDGDTNSIMHSAGGNAWAHIKLANLITLGELKKIIVWNRGGPRGKHADGTTIKLYNGETLLHKWILEGHHRSYSFDL